MVSLGTQGVRDPGPRRADDASPGARAAQDAALRPGSLEEAAELLRALARDRRPVAFAGGGTEPWPEEPAEGVAVLHTAGLGRIREHAPADQIVVAEAGVTLAALQRHLAPHGQRLALDPPLPERATLGGIVAAGSFGPRRTRAGGVRDLIIGIALVRDDGAIARGGGRVVKNVAGFDLPRLLCGSQGTLGLVAEVTFRLHPLPEVSETVTVDGVDAASAWALWRAVRDARLEPAAVVALPEGDALQLAVRFEGFGPGVRDQVERLLALAARLDEGRRAARRTGEDEAAIWARHDALRTAGDVRARATFVPARLPAVAPALGALAGALAPPASAGGLRSGAVVVYPALGIAFVTGELADAARAAAALAEARAAVAPGHGAVVLAAAPAPLRARAGLVGAPSPALPLHRRLKAAFDPEGRLAPGRLPGGGP